MLLHLIFLQVLSMIIGAMTILILQNAYKIKRLNHKKLYAKLAYRLDQMKKGSQRLSAVRHLVNERLDTVNCFIAAEMSHRHDYAAAMLDKLTRDSNYFMESTKASFEIAHPEFLDFLKDSGLSEWEIGCCCLYSIGLNGNEISVYLNRKSFYNISCNIRKKLKMETGANIDTFLKQKMMELDNLEVSH